MHKYEELINHNFKSEKDRFIIKALSDLDYYPTINMRKDAWKETFRFISSQINNLLMKLEDPKEKNNLEEIKRNIKGLYSIKEEDHSKCFFVFATKDQTPSTIYYSIKGKEADFKKWAPGNWEGKTKSLWPYKHKDSKKNKDESFDDLTKFKSGLEE